MFVKTQFDTIVNLSEFQKIKIEWYVKQPSGNTFHVISAVSEEIITPTGVNKHPKHVSKSETLAQFSEDMKTQTDFVYTALFNALLNGDTAFDMTDYLEASEIR